IAGTTGAGSELVTDYIVPATMLDGADRALFDSHATRVAELGEPWLSFFRPDELEMHLQQIGLALRAGRSLREIFCWALRLPLSFVSLPYVSPIEGAHRLTAGGSTAFSAHSRGAGGCRAPLGLRPLRHRAGDAAEDGDQP